jgi:hypothetical protein
MSKRNPFADLEALRQGANVVVDFPSAKTPRKAKRNQRLVAFPWAFLVDVCRLAKGRTTLVVAAYIYRRTHVCNSQTVTLPGTELIELGIDRSMKRKALARLAAAGLVRVELDTPGRTTKVTLLWGA